MTSLKNPVSHQVDSYLQLGSREINVAKDGANKLEFNLINQIKTTKWKERITLKKEKAQMRKKAHVLRQKHRKEHAQPM